MNSHALTINYDPHCDLETALSREWLETNGIGGFASSTIAGLNSRRYHGLLIAALHPPVGRVALLSKLEETLVIDGQRIELSANQYPGVVHPQGYRYLTQFRLDPFPVFTYVVNGCEIEKSVFMVYGENTTVVQYELRQGGHCRLELRPLLSFRDYHHTARENGALNRKLELSDGVISVKPYDGLPSLHFAHDADAVDSTGYWYRNFEYAIERERGLDFTEDLFSPFAMTFALDERANATAIASLQYHRAEDALDFRDTEIARRRAVLAVSPEDSGVVRQLTLAADQFIVSRGEQKTIIAGYHWFSDWGRDTMIALPGLTLITGRFDVAKSILLEFARHVDRGMIPNRFPDAGETPDYNTVDATLWLFEAVRSLLRYTQDYDFIRTHLYDVLADIIQWHVRGTRYGIRLDDDGLVRAGEPGTQLTWMDAKVGDWVVTPRQGKAVEIQALWYNALRVMEQLSEHFGEASKAQEYHRMASRAKRSFNRLFWNEDAGCLYDVIDGDRVDGAIRPNQILAVSLPYSMLSQAKAVRVVETVERHLLTPYGLRSLSPNDPNYRGRYEGDQWQRDGAYHQGTVWAWLMGPFITAYVRVHGRTKKARAQAAQWLMALEQHVAETGLGQISEIFDGDPPHRSRGCIAQAWSVGELLRAIVEDLPNG